MAAAPFLRSLQRRMAGVGIRGRLLLIVLAMGVPFLAYLSISSLMQLVAARQYAHRLMQSTAQLTAARLDDRLANLRTLIATLAATSGSDVADTAPNDALLQRIAPELAGRAHAVTLWSADARNIGSSVPRATAVATPAERSLVHRALATDGLVAGTRLDAQGTPLVMVAQAVQREDRAPVVVAVSLRLEQGRERLLTTEQPLPAHTVLTLMDGDGLVLARSADPARWVGRPSGATPARVAELRRLAPGARETLSLEGQRRVMGYAATRALPLLVWVGMPVDAALAPAREKLAQSLALGLGLLALALGLALWAGRAVAAPLQQLSEDAARFGAGDLSHRHRSSSLPEARRLAHTLNAMADALQERTRAQHETEAMLREITDNMPALISLVDRHGTYLFANSTHQAWFGAERVFVGRHVGGVLGQRMVAPLREQLLRAYAGERSALECRASIGGAERWLHVTMVPRRDAGGEVRGIYMMTIDITERRDAELRLGLSEQRLSMALEASGLALFDWDVAQRRMYYSSQSSVMLGGPPTETLLTDRQRIHATHPDDLPRLLATIGTALKGPTERFQVEYRLRGAQGQWVWILSRGRVVARDAEGRALRVTGTDANITEHKTAEQRLRQLAEHDHLTGLPNRALLMDRLQHAAARAHRHHGLLAVMFVDIDRFKHVNDTLGHAAGDAVLVAHARRLQGRVRHADTVARLSGDEFTVLLEDLADPAGAHALAQALVQAAREPVVLDDGTVLRTTISVGLALSVPGDGEDGAGLLRRADDALYEAKRRGRDQYAVAGDDALMVNGSLF